MKFQPRGFQVPSIEHAVNFLANAKAGERQLYGGPTGCGKSVIILGVHQRVPGLFIVTPRDEIVQGFLDKLGTPDADPESLGIWTPIKLRNRLLDGRVRTPKGLILDETHHESAETWQQLDLLTGLVPTVGYTATPYRGTPKSTADFLERWGPPTWLISHDEAAAEGYIKLPDFQMLPLVDDDEVEVSGGEFTVTSLEGATVSRLDDLVNHCQRYHNGTEWDKATMFSVPSTKLCEELHRRLLAKGLPAAIVNAATPKTERWSIFAATEQRALALIQINVVSEGVDLKIRRLIDLSPTLSPVRWVQQLGRIERPTDESPEYVCTNRNLLRHAYALDGAVPLPALKAAEEAFVPTKRGAGVRVLGMEAIGRFKANTLKCADGLTGHMYTLSTLSGRIVVEYACIVHPAKAAIWARKINTTVDGVRNWGKWEACEPPKDLKGFSSVPPKALSDKQMAWWNRSAQTRGLDPSQELTRKNFQALPVLMDLGERL